MKSFVIILLFAVMATGCEKSKIMQCKATFQSGYTMAGTADNDSEAETFCVIATAAHPNLLTCECR